MHPFPVPLATSSLRIRREDLDTRLTVGSYSRIRKGNQVTDTVDWVLVADRSRARIYETTSTKRSLSQLISFDHVEGRLHRQDMESDQEGRLCLPGGAGASPEPREDAKHREARRFASELCDYLDAACRKDQFDQLIVVAPPFFLGVLRHHLPTNLKSRITCEYDQELLPLSDAQILVRLEAMIREKSVQHAIGN